VADLAALRRADAAGFAGGIRRHVVVEHEASRYSPISASMICSSRAVPSVATTSACVSPRVNSAEPCVRGSTPVRMRIGRTVRVSRTVDPRLARQDLLADDLRFESRTACCLRAGEHRARRRHRRIRVDLAAISFDAAASAPASSGS
jgi:hypothetical protein